MVMSLDTALQQYAIAQRQLAGALKELAAAERAAEGSASPCGLSPATRRVETLRSAFAEAEIELADAPVRTVWAFLIKVEALAGETMSPEAAIALRRDANALLDAQSRRAA